MHKKRSKYIQYVYYSFPAGRKISGLINKYSTGLRKNIRKNAYTMFGKINEDLKIF